MSGVFFLNLFSSIGCFLIFVFVFIEARFLFVKPSIVLLAFTHIFFQWPSVFLVDKILRSLPDPWSFSFLVNSYVFFGLLVAILSFHDEARLIWAGLGADAVASRARYGKAILILGFLVFLVLCLYFSEVPVSSTGLYAILFDPANAVLAREKSLKLLDNKFVAYAYSLMCSSVAPIFAASLGLLLANSIRRKVFSYCAGLVLLFGGLSLSVSLTGARAPAVNLFIVAGIALLLRYRFRINPLLLGGGLLVTLFPAVVISLMREGKGLRPEFILEYFNYIFYRAFVDPMDMGIIHSQYSQNFGFFGISGLTKLASLFGMHPVDVPNVVGRYYYPRSLESVSANAGYIYCYYSYFGLSALALLIPSVLILDSSLLVLSRFRRELQVPILAALLFSTLMFITSDYGTVLVTHGFGMTLGLGSVLNLTLKEEGTRSYGGGNG
jgi:hypothetical protein